MRCGKHNATISTATCLRFQEANKSVRKRGDKCFNPMWGKTNDRLIPHRACLDCEQGKAVAKAGKIIKKRMDADIDRLRYHYERQLLHG